MDGTYANTHTHAYTHSQSSTRLPEADLWSNKSSSLGNSHTHKYTQADPCTHHNPAKCRALHILFPLQHTRDRCSLWYYICFCNTHKSQIHTHTHTHTKKSLLVLRRTLTHFLIGTRGEFLVQDCTTDPDCWLCESDWEKRNIERGWNKERQWKRAKHRGREGVCICVYMCVCLPFRPLTWAVQLLFGAVAKMDGGMTSWQAGSRTPWLFGWQAAWRDGWLDGWMSALEQGS